MAVALYCTSIHANIRSGIFRAYMVNRRKDKQQSRPKVCLKFATLKQDKVVRPA